MSFSFSVLTAMILICLAGFLMGLRAFDYASEHGDLGENRQNRAPRGYGSTLTHMQTVYLEGNPYATRTAEPSYVITVDVRHSLWGFCPFTVVKAEQCGLAGGCVDSNSCSEGCGFTNHPHSTTFTCTQPGRAYCSTALLTLANSEGPYTYLACGESPATEQYLAVPTAEATVTPTRTNFPTITVISTMPPGYTYDPQMFAGFNATHLPFELSVSPGVVGGGVTGILVFLGIWYCTALYLGRPVRRRVRAPGPDIRRPGGRGNRHAHLEPPPKVKYRGPLDLPTDLMQDDDAVELSALGSSSGHVDRSLPVDLGETSGEVGGEVSGEASQLDQDSKSNSSVEKQGIVTEDEVGQNPCP